MFNSLKEKAKNIATSETVQKGASLAKDYATEQVKDQVETVKFSVKMYLYGFLAVIILVVGILATGLYKLITL